MLEKDIENTVVNWAKKHGWLVVKVRFVDVGYPDRLFLSPVGHTVFIEFKKPGSKPDPLQGYRMRSLRARNIPAYWCDSAIEAISILKTAMEPEDVYDSSSPLPAVTGIRRAISRSGPRQDVDGPSYDKDPEEPKHVPTGIDRSPSESDL